MANRETDVARSAIEALRILWKESFFQRWRNQASIVEHLAKRRHHFSPPELGMALGRAKHLTRRGKRGNYEYIQKYPFVEEQQPYKQAKKR
jgi:hypothetical protein